MGEAIRTWTLYYRVTKKHINPQQIAGTYIAASIILFVLVFGILLNSNTITATAQQQQMTGTIKGVGASEVLGGVCSNSRTTEVLTLNFDASFLISSDRKAGTVTSGTGVLKTAFSEVFAYLLITGGDINIGVEPKLYSLKGTATFQSPSHCNLPPTADFSIDNPGGTQLKCGNSGLIRFNSIPITGSVSGNVDCTLVDTTPPTVGGALTPNIGGQKGVYTNPVTVTWSGDDDGSGIASCDNPTTYSGPDRSSILLEGYCRDKAGNVGKGSVIITYDANPPNINTPGPIRKEATSPTGATVAYSVSATDAVDRTFYITSDCYPASGSIFKFGTTTVTCKTVDGASSIVTSKTFTVTIQHTTPPQNVKIISTIDSYGKPVLDGATNVPSSNFITIELSRPVGIAGITSLKCSIDGNTRDCPSTGSVSYSNLSPGSHTFVFTAKDAAGNEASDRFRWIIPPDAQ